MDDKTRLLLCLSAAVAANCIPCAEHYLARAAELGVPKETVREVAELAHQVNRGAQLISKSAVQNIVGPPNGLVPEMACGQPGRD